MEQNLDIAKGFTFHVISNDFMINLQNKNKKVENKVEIFATGGGPTRCHQFNDMEEAVIRILELNTSVDPPGNDEGARCSANAELQSVKIAK